MQPKPVASVPADAEPTASTPGVSLDASAPEGPPPPARSHSAALAEASAAEVAHFVGEQVAFLGRAPWLTREVQCQLQRAIDDGDAGLAMAARDQLLHYLREWATLTAPLHAATSVGDLLPLAEHGLALARSIDLARLNQTREDTRRSHEAIVSSLLQTVRGDWHRGQPTQSARATPPSGALSPTDLVAAVDAGIQALVERLQRGEQVDAYDAQLDDRLRRRVERLGARPGPVDVSDRDVVYEFLAHRFAYRPDAPGAAEMIEAAGFHRRPLSFRTSSGLDFFVVEPRAKGHPAVVVFRGTEPDDLKDIKTDLEFQIGSEHFAAARTLGLAGLLRACRTSTGVPPDLTGHSLGGALCQLTAAEWPELVGRLVTFQAPGLTRRNAQRGEAGLARHRLADPGPRVTHYIADEDIVHKAGQRHLNGRVILATGVHLDVRAGFSFGLGHSDMLLATHRERARLERLNLAGHWSAHTLAVLGELPDHPTTVGSFHEAVRATVALGLELVQAHLRNPDQPDVLARLLPRLAAEAIGEDDLGAVRIAARIARRVVRESPRFARGVARSVRRREPPEEAE